MALTAREREEKTLHSLHHTRIDGDFFLPHGRETLEEKISVSDFGGTLTETASERPNILSEKMVLSREKKCSKAQREMRNSDSDDRNDGRGYASHLTP